MTGVDCPAMSAVQSEFSPSGVHFSGRFFSSLDPFWCGPRQLSQPSTLGGAGLSAANDTQDERIVKKNGTSSGVRLNLTLSFPPGRAWRPPCVVGARLY